MTTRPGGERIGLRSPRLLIALVVVLVAALAFTGFVAFRDDDRQGVEELYLFVQTARSGSLVPTESGTYILTLEGADSDVVFFSDRPDRDTGTISPTALISEVFDPADAPPNAALVVTVPERPEITLAFELRNPNFDPDSATMTYEVTPLAGLSPGLAHLSLDDIDSVTGTFSDPSLFIDSDSYHRCYGYLENTTDFTFTLADTDPVYGSSKWGDYPPETIPPNTTAQWKFRFHSNTSDKTAVVRYDGGGIDTLGVDFSVEYSMSCAAGLSDTGAQVIDSSCVVSHFDTFTCTKTDLSADEIPSGNARQAVKYQLVPSN